MTTTPDKDTISYVIVVRGVFEAAYNAFAARFPQHRGGVSPGLAETYLSVERELADVDRSLSWIAENLTAQYREISLGISIYTPRNWSNFDIPQEVIQSVEKSGASLRVMFASTVAAKEGIAHDA